MNIMVHTTIMLLIAFLLNPIKAATTPWTQKFNRDFITGSLNIIQGNT